ncbi:hypothetical protein M9H77_20124 [Catharanthus roseus]|uniref:Uncharacterized protein n=1 Tax=Catharanthus roseus TaxID=4058 RepID=A0ACC0AJL8_CATRO|nr:hypothetical protein M9H77_20124 [Catharanthus roseus]
MAYNKSFFSIFLAFSLMFNILSDNYAFAGRDISGKKKLNPHSFIHDGTVLVPGLGRYYLFPRPGDHFNPFTYNPVTGTSGGGTGVSIPGIGGGSGSTGGAGSYVPGGDDTLLPNPGVEVPNPSGGGASPSTP